MTRRRIVYASRIVLPSGHRLATIRRIRGYALVDPAGRLHTVQNPRTGRPFPALYATADEARRAAAAL